MTDQSGFIIWRNNPDGDDRRGTSHEFEYWRDGEKARDRAASLNAVSLELVNVDRKAQYDASLALRPRRIAENQALADAGLEPRKTWKSIAPFEPLTELPHFHNFGGGSYYQSIDYYTVEPIEWEDPA